MASLGGLSVAQQRQARIQSSQARTRLMRETALKLTGDVKLLALLAIMNEKAQRKALKSGLGKAARTFAKETKKAVPVRYKEARKLIGTSVGKTKKAVFVAKFGFGVGAAYEKVAKRSSNNLGGFSKGVAQPKGAGMAGRNMHWFAIGTGQRSTNKPKRNTGVMPPVLKGAVEHGFSAGRSKAFAQIRESVVQIWARQAGGRG
jgi:hypothetical protein